MSKNEENDDKDYIVINQSPVKPILQSEEERKIIRFFSRSYFLCYSLAGATEQGRSLLEAVFSPPESELDAH